MPERAASTTDPHVEAALVRAHAVAAFVALFVAVTFGILASLQFVLPDLVGGVPALSWGRLRYNHTQGIMLGWLGNAFLAFLYYAVPLLSGRRITSARLGWWLFGIWNLAVMVPGWVLVSAGISQPLEWAEFPLAVDAVVVVALALFVVQFVAPFLRTRLDDLYVSGWYVIGALVFTLLAYPMGNLVPASVPGAASAAWSGLWIHDAVGLFVTPLALAILYFVIPAVTRRPIYSHFLSMIGFWGLFFIYPLNGTHHYVFSVIPMAAQLGAIAASTILGLDVVIVVFNLLMSARGTGLVARDAGLRFVLLSTVFYLVVSLQGSVQAQMQFNQAVHFTDWVVGHSHLAMLGFATFAAIGGIVHVWPRLPGARFDARAVNHGFWLLTTGVILMVTDLTLAGLVQADLWLEQAPWLESVRASQPYWIVRTVAAVPVAAGFVTLFVALLTGPRVDSVTAPDAAVSPMPAEFAAVLSGRGLRQAYAVASVAGLVFFAMSAVLLGVWPARVLAEETRLTAPAGGLTLSAAEARGRAVYAREGCGYCHTQQIRFTQADIARFGAPTMAWETRFDYPHLWGTRRIGPDLARAGGTRPPDWHFVHLYAPRDIVSGSVMPAYPWLFEGSPAAPTQDGRDLVAYLETLGRARELAYPEGDAAALGAAPDRHMVRMAVEVAELNAHPGRARTGSDAPALTVPEAVSERGRDLWTQHCASCHGADGRGAGPAARWLRPAPTDLTTHDYAASRLADALWNGGAGTSMPAWRDLPADDRAALAAMMRSFAPPPDDTPVADDVVALGRQVFATHCAQCHGREGGGDGFAARQFPVAPTDFTRQRPTFEAAVTALTMGVAGTSMAPWGDRLNGAEIEAVARVLRLFYRPESSAGGGR